MISRDTNAPKGNFDSEAFRRALHEISGSISPEDAERRKERLYRWREEGSRPITRRDDLAANCDPCLVLQRLRKVSGKPSNEAAERYLEIVRLGRQAGSRPPDRP